MPKRSTELPPPPPLLYHYTSAEGLLGILSSGKLWATDIEYLNDTSELVYATEILRECLVSRVLEQHSSSPAIRSLVDKLLSWTEQPLRFQDQSPESQRLFVACLCENGDLLSQWRGYAGGVGGFAIGLDFKDARATSSYNLLKIKYEPEIQTRAIERELAGLIERLLERVRDDEWLHELQIGLAQQESRLLRCMLRFKSPAFHEEAEWRTITIVEAGRAPGGMVPEFRTNGSLIIPFIPLNLSYSGQLPLKEIVIGPSPQSLLAQKSLLLLLATLGYSDVAVRRSSVPLRS